MRSLFTHLLVLIVLASCAAPLLADDFAGFRIPKHRVYYLTASLNGEFRSHRWGDPGTLGSTVWSSGRQNETFGDAYASGYYLFDSDPWRVSLSASPGLNGNRRQSSSRQNDYFNYLSDYNSDQRNLSESASLIGDARSYPWKAPVGFLMNLNAVGEFDQQWYSYTSATNHLTGSPRYRNIDNMELTAHRYEVRSDLGIGLGRVRDATTVYDVYVLQKRLLEAGALTRELSPASKEKLVSLFYLEGDYKRVHERSSKFFWEEVEKILRADGALKDVRLDAYSLFRIGESYLPPNASPNSNEDFAPGEQHGWSSAAAMRQTGYFVGPLFEADHYNYIFRQSERLRQETYQDDTLNSSSVNSNYSHSRRTSDVYAIGLFGEYHRPLSWRWQLDAMSALLLPLKNADEAIIVRNQLTANYLIADRWWAAFQFAHNRQIVKYPGTPSVLSSWWTAAEVDVAYFVEDHLSLNLKLSQTQRWRNWGYFMIPPWQGESVPGTPFQLDYDARIGLSYHFLGRADAPGLIQPLTIMPWR